MTNLLLTLAMAVVANLAVLVALKVGLRAGQRGGWCNHQPC